MMLSVKPLGLVLALSIAPATAHAGWGKKEDMPVYLESSVEKIYVKADGSREEEGDSTIVVQKEKGIDGIKIMRIPYDPNLAKFTIVSAATINNGVAVPVPPSSIEDKAIAASGGQGLRNQNMITIAFPALAVGSKVQFKMKRTYNAPFVPGLFHMRLGMATHFFTEKDVTEIRSEIPLVIRHKGASDIISVEEGKEGNLHKYTISLLRPSFRVPLGEPRAAIKDDTMPRIEIGAAGKTWAEVAKHFSPKVEEVLSAPLHPDFEAIVAKAAKAPSNVERARIAMAELIDKVKYLGDWRTERGFFLPKSFTEVAQSKQGDCKDFSGITVAMLRKLGMKAHVAWVHRGAEDAIVAMLSRSHRAFDPLLPGDGHFNHAIVAAEIDGATYWLDPTNPMAHVGPPFGDIADRVALVLKPESTELSRIPKASSSFSVASSSYLAFRPSGRADVLHEVHVKGSMVAEMNRALSDHKDPKDAERAKFALLSFAEPPGPIDHPGVVSEIEPETKAKTGPAEAREQFVYVLEGKGTKTSLGHSFVVPEHPAADLIGMANGNRVTGVSLGEKGVFTAKYMLANFQLQGDLPENCELGGPWLRVSRKFEKKQSGIELTDKVETLRDEIAINDVNSREFEEFKKKFETCFEEPQLVYKWRLPDGTAKSHAPFLNPLLRNKKDLVWRAGKVNDGTSQDYFRYVYLRLLLWEHLQAHTRKQVDVADALGLIAISVLNQSMQSADNYEPVGKAEHDMLISLVEQLDPEAIAANLSKGHQAIRLGNFKGAIEYADRMIAKDPKSHRGYRLKFHAWRRAPATEEIRQARSQQTIEKVQQLLADSRVSCHTCLLESMIYALEILGKHDEVEKAHRKMIELEPKSAWALLNFAGYLNGREMFEEAAENARKSLAVAPVGMAHLQLSWALSGLAVREIAKDPVSPKAVALCEEALQSMSRNRNCLKVLAWAYENKFKLTNDEQLLAISHRLLDAEQQYMLSESDDSPKIPQVVMKEIFWKKLMHNPDKRFRALVPTRISDGTSMSVEGGKVVHHPKGWIGPTAASQAPSTATGPAAPVHATELGRAPASVTPVEIVSSPEQTGPAPAGAGSPISPVIPAQSAQYGPPLPAADRQ